MLVDINSVLREGSVESVDKYRNIVRELKRTKVTHFAVSGVLPVLGKSLKTLGVWQLMYRSELCVLRGNVFQDGMHVLFKLLGWVTHGYSVTIYQI